MHAHPSSHARPTTKARDDNAGEILKMFLKDQACRQGGSLPQGKTSSSCALTAVNGFLFLTFNPFDANRDSHA
jgi:hypothetical protein